MNLLNFKDLIVEDVSEAFELNKKTEADARTKIETRFLIFFLAGH